MASAPDIPGAPNIRALVVADYAADGLRTSLRQTVSAARQLGGALREESHGGPGCEVHVLVAGNPTSSAAVVREARALHGVAAVKVAETIGDAVSSVEETAALILACAADYTHILAADSGFNRSVLSRVAALLGVEPITGVTGIASADTFVRPIHAGNALLTVRSRDPVKILTVRTANFAPASFAPAEAGAEDGNVAIAAIATVTAIAPAPSPVAGVAALLERQRAADRAAGNAAPPLDSARIVVAGGRGLGSTENFTALLAPLARQLGAALGASYGAVSAGYAANALQIGQTGRIIAPELYVAVGISGAIQHLAGIREARVVVAIDKNPEAPIFKAADYGLAADLFEAVPALTRALEALGGKT